MSGFIHNSGILSVFGSVFIVMFLMAGVFIPVFPGRSPDRRVRANQERGILYSHNEHPASVLQHIHHADSGQGSRGDVQSGRQFHVVPENHMKVCDALTPGISYRAGLRGAYGGWPGSRGPRSWYLPCCWPSAMCGAPLPQPPVIAYVKAELLRALRDRGHAGDNLRRCGAR